MREQAHVLHVKIDQSHAILDQAIAEYQPSTVVAMFSGGDDSFMTTHITMSYLQSAYPALPSFVAHINTGIGIEETRQFVRHACASFAWTLKEYKTPVDYEQIILKHGFPGPAGHRYMYILLKERAIMQLVREHKQSRHDRILFVTGVRREESTRRMGHVEPIKQEGVRVWVAPLIDWTKMDLRDYKDAYHLPHNEVVDLLHMSGECLCGSFAKPGELEMLKDLYPDVADRICDLQERAKCAGVPCRWGHRPPGWHQQIKQGQQMLPGTFMALCTSCDARFEEDVS